MIDHAYHLELQGVCRQVFARLGEPMSSALMASPPRRGYPAVPPVREQVPDPAESHPPTAEAYLADYAGARAAAVSGKGASREIAMANMRRQLGQRA